MSNVIGINLISNPNNGDTVSFKITVGGVPFTISETFVTSPIGSNQVQIGSTNLISAQNLALKLASDYPTYIGTMVIGNQVKANSLNGSPPYAMATNAPLRIEFEFIEASISINGLEYDRYLINNEIWISIGTGTLVEYFNVTIANNFTGGIPASAVVYPNISGVARLNISPYLKSLFANSEDPIGYNIDNQVVPNVNAFTITASSDFFEAASITKTFIRGGKRTNETNQTLPSLSQLRPTLRLPIWQGYDTAGYELDENNVERKVLLATFPEESKDYRRLKGCNSIYCKFLNQQGGYSNWLFESHTITESGNNLGSYIRDNKVDDLGNEFDSKCKLYSKVPEYYRDLIRDLIVSHEIYLTIDGIETRVVLGKNSMPYDKVSRTYTVNINFDFDYRFNPTPLWSN